MPFEDPPPLPGFVREHLPFDRRAYRLESGPFAGRRVHLLDHGPREGRPVLLVHGNPTWSFLWRAVIARLPGFRCVAPDLVGFGLSDGPRRVSAHTLDAHLAALREVTARLDLGPGLILVGQDWGGPLVVGAGLRHAQGVSGLVLGNTSVLVPASPRGTWFHRFAHLPVVSDLVFRGLGFPQRYGIARAQGDPASISGVVARAYRWPLRGPLRRAGPLGLARMVPSGPEHPSLPALREIEAWARAYRGPARLVWGERDPILGRALKKHAAVFTQAEVTRTEAGHFLQEEVPDLLAAAVEQVAATSA